MSECDSKTIFTTLPEEVQWKGAIDGETLWGRCGEYLAISIESGII